jgi:hypothetical protein
MNIRTLLIFLAYVVAHMYTGLLKYSNFIIPLLVNKEWLLLSYAYVYNADL